MVERTKLDPAVRYRAPRVRLDPRPRFEWGGVFEGYARSFLVKNAWRTKLIIGDTEDALQECAIVFLRCCKTYEGQLRHPAQMMAIYKRALANEWNTLSRKDTARREIPIPEPAELIDYNQGFLLAALSEASASVQSLCKILGDAPAEFLALMFGSEGEPQETPEAVAHRDTLMNRRVKRLLGISDPSADVIGELRALLGKGD